ncbi:hypothetical protein RHMOL_Rhmol07G0309800 [Rhododendron molle]|uniref:Uncharacterized protein n=1 Tax=Rhododendron molle TaxID=49168 RepID=A0ACC0N6J9_RHOML|nr:hypothetical protein RHMOL_Rhmol07G0309800 [Rhododendron molle]
MGMAGRLIRDSSGNWVFGFQRKDVVASSSTAVECWALRDGLQLVLERNLIGILVETDSLTLVQLLKQKVLCNHELINMLFDCRVLLDRLKTKVCHVYRDGNRSGDAIERANLSSSDHNFFNIQSIPNGLNHQR